MNMITQENKNVNAINLENVHLHIYNNGVELLFC